MKYVLQVFLLISLLLCTLNGVAQLTNYKDIEKSIGASPSTASLGTFGGIEIKKSTGGISKLIPVFQVKEGLINYSSSLQYFSTGVKINEWGGHLGLDWTDNFTAVVQRVCRSVPDELATSRLTISSSDINAQGLLDIKSAHNSTESGSGKDSEYDTFYYNIFGAAGSFLIINGEAKLLNHQNLVDIKVLSNQPYEFCITTTDGLKYYFGGNSSSNIEYSKIDPSSSCYDNGSPTQEVATAWYLTQIRSPLNDVITFNYASASSYFIYDFVQTQTLKHNRESFDDYSSNAASTPGYYVTNNLSSCTYRKWTKTKYLTSITGSSFSMAFDYSERNDLVGEKLLNRVSLYDKTSNLINRLEIEYDEVLSGILSVENQLGALSQSEKVNLCTRYFIKSLRFGNLTNPSIQRYEFNYRNKEQLPARFSFAQDLGGYYNGTGNYGFIPEDMVSQYLQADPASNLNAYQNSLSIGDRKPTFYSAIGLLEKITYPTGGNDIIEYEPNSYTKNVSSQELIRSTHAFVNESQNDMVTGSSQIFQVPRDEIASITAEIDYDAYPPLDPSDDGSLYHGEVELWNLTNNYRVALPMNFYSVQTLELAYHQQYTGDVMLTAGVNYQFKYKVYGRRTFIAVGAAYQGPIIERAVEQIYFGNRVKKIISNPISSGQLVKVYDYRKFLKQDGKLVFDNEISMAKVEPHLNDYCDRFLVQDVICSGAGSFCQYPKTYYHRFSSSSKSNINFFQGATVAYRNVTEFLNEGKSSFIASEFDAAPDDAGSIILGDDISKFPLSNSGWNNGLERTRYFGSALNGNNNIKREINWLYSVSPASFVVYDNYVVHKKYESPYSGIPYELSSYTIIRYPLISRWYKLDRLTQTDYPESSAGLVPISMVNTYEYNNADKMIAKETALASEGDTLISIINRPSSMVTSNLDPTGIYQAMVNKGILDPVIIKTEFKGSKKLSLEKTNYYSPFSNIYLPQSVETQISNYPTDSRFKYLAYDSKGNLLSYQMSDGQKTCFIWGYGGQHVIAKVVNADYNDVSSIMGGASAIENFRNISVPSNSQLNSFLAPLITNGLPNTQITTYAYNPLIGLASTTDPKGQTTYYEYDSFQRLKNIKDQNGNIVKSYDYHYKTQN